MRIALIGDYNEAVVAHQAIPLALALSAKTLKIHIEYEWLPTDAIQSLSSYDAIWCVPGSPYRDMNGALSAIRYARENLIPFLGTCGGFQHAILEFARNVLLLKESNHMESNPHTSLPLIVPLVCSLKNSKGVILLKDGSNIKKIHNQESIEEDFNCNFGVNPNLQYLLEKNSFIDITGLDSDGNIRVIELTDHPFFIATLYQPERSALKGITHPLITAFLEAGYK